MMNLNDVAIMFNKEIVKFRPDCYAIVEDGGHILAIWLDGAPVVKVDANRKINVLLKPGLTAYRILMGCFPDSK